MLRLRPSTTRRGALVRATATALTPLLLAMAAMSAVPATAQPPAERHHSATITITRHGIAHVVADDFESLAFGMAEATAPNAICNLADTLLTARAERSRWLGPKGRYNDRVTLDATNLQVDALLTDIHDRRVVERLLRDPVRGPSEQAKALVRGYVAGLNDWLRGIGGSRNIADPTCRGARWIKPVVTALDLWYGVYAAQLLASTGVFVPQIVDAAPPTPSDPGLPVAGGSAHFQQPPSELPDADALMTALGKDPDTPFGSNATAVGSADTTTGRGMVLGNPHFPWRGRYRFTQTHLTIPGRYDVAGASLIGAPVINIGWNKDVAWSHTVSTAYRFTPYEYKTVGDPTTYLTENGPTPLDHRHVAVTVRRKDGSLDRVREDLYRTKQGYVAEAPSALLYWTPSSFWALRDANAEHLRVIDTFNDMAKADSVRDLLRRQDEGAGMPWVNTIAADRAGHVLYADHSVVPNVPDDLVDQCVTPVGEALFQVAGLPGLDGTRAQSSCRWRTDSDSARPGIFGPGNLPDTVRRDWVANANDSYWLPNPRQRLEGFARIIGCERCERTLRTRMVYHYVLDRLAGEDGLAAGRKVSPRTLRSTEHKNRVYGAELARRGGDLLDVCHAADGGQACRVLRRWDGRSDVDSVGTQIFQEFWRRAQDATVLWEVPFDPQHPVATPRNLAEQSPDVVQAMSDALAFLRRRHVPMRSPWGSLQVAGDDGAPAIPIGGGEGFAGNANAVSSRTPGANRDRLYPVSYGSSHIQAVSFGDHGRVDAHTILTYSQSMNPRSRWSADQTRLFSQERWARFPWTDAQIDRQAVRTYRVSD